MRPLGPDPAAQVVPNPRTHPHPRSHPHPRTQPTPNLKPNYPAAQGDGLLGLPTLVHRGPGGNDAQALDRSVLFFTVVRVRVRVRNSEGLLPQGWRRDARCHEGDSNAPLSAEQPT